MSVKRVAFWGRLKKSCIKKYEEYHDNIWPEVVEAYRKAGVLNMTIFRSGVDLFGYYELDEEIYERVKESLRENEAEVKWQALMATLRAKNQPKEQPHEIFHF